jgi:3-oxoacyl-[acyl-carrier protein] reductase
MKPVVVISGTSRGIGKALAEHYLLKGYTVHGCSRGEATISDKDYFHGKLDVSDEQQLMLWVRKIKRTGAKVEILICNAGIAPANVLGIMAGGELARESINVNYFGSFYLMREISKIMMQQKYGRVVTFSSMAAGLHDAGSAVYSSAKSAIVETTKIFAKELAGQGITFNVVAPSVVETQMAGQLGPEVINQALSRLTISRPVTMNEICHTVDFFTSPESGCITGQVIYMGLVC